MRRILGLVGLLGALAVPAAAQATTQTAHDGTITAKLSWTGTGPAESGLKLSISMGGFERYDQPIRGELCGTHCDAASFGHAKAVRILDLDHTGVPQVIVSLYTGGAHCCSVAQVFNFDPGTQSYDMSQLNFGDPGYRIEDLGGGGHYDFVTANDAFAYRFTDYAASGLPIQIVQWLNGQFVDATVAYPKLEAQDAARWLKAYKAQAKSKYSDSTGVIAAWAADEYALGHVARANAYLAAQARLGHLNSALSPAEPSGMAFVAKLKAFLHAQGYGSLPAGAAARSDLAPGTPVRTGR